MKNAEKRIGELGIEFPSFQILLDKGTTSAYTQDKNCKPSFFSKEEKP